MVKDERISTAIERLLCNNPSWRLIDFWEADDCAVGIANSTGSRLMYVSVFDMLPNGYEYVGERLDEANSCNCPTGKVESLEELEAVARRWLNNEPDVGEPK